ncbi:putative homeobox protein [Escherichia coli]|uniref:Putative homeobox protein n=1 Tax=Escherichia coli TaxID=562 RepID=A0A377AYV3_ECOLX|nr:putative homeobox protein [Escherichia coli]
MKMTKLATLFLTATLSLASGAALAADSGAQTNNGQANAAADAGQVAPDARENVAPNNVDNNGGKYRFWRHNAAFGWFFNEQ